MKRHTAYVPNSMDPYIIDPTYPGQHRAVIALAAYEDSGFTPDEVKKGAEAIRAALGLACMAQSAKDVTNIIPKERLQEAAQLLQKKDAGLLIECPAKIGDKVWCILNRTGKLVEDFIEDMDVWSMRDGIKVRLRLRQYNDYVVGTFGETVFLNEEAAKAAVKERREASG